MSYYYIEVTDGDAVTRSGAAMADLGTRMARTSQPPATHFGDDQFGAAMREQYPSDAEIGEIQTQQTQLGGHLSELGTNLAAAIAGLYGQDGDSAERLTAV